MSAPSPLKRDTLISKSLAYLLRHGAEKEKLPIDSQGWVPVTAVLAHNRLKSHKAKLEDIQRIVAQNEKQRFKLKEENSVYFICANQGHTLKNVVPDLQKLDKSTIPTRVYHGTYAHKLEQIKETGLSRMARNHIHMTSDAEWSKSGIRNNCDTLVYIDTRKCMDAGLVFWRSANGVLLCEGNEQGVILPSFFESVEKVQKAAKSGDAVREEISGV